MFGDIVLVPFPFTNQTATKQRPAVIVSTQAYAAARPDVILMAVTSRVRTPPAHGEVVIIDWEAAGLLKPSTIKPVLATIEQALVLKRLGALEPEDRIALKQAIATILG